MMPPRSGLRTGERDLVEVEKERDLLAIKAKEEADERERLLVAHVHLQAEAMAVKRKAKHDAMLARRQQNWQQMMGNVQLAAAKRNISSKQLKLAHAKQEITRSRWEKTSDGAEKRRVMEELTRRNEEVEEARKAAHMTELALARASASEAQALAKQKEVEQQLGVTSLKLVQAVGQQRFTKGVLRAKEIKLTKLEHEAQNRPKGGRGGGDEDGKEGDGGEEEGDDSDLPQINEDELLSEAASATKALVVKLDESIGKRDSWPKTTTDKYVAIADFCTDRLLVVCKAQKATKRGKIEAQVHRRAAIEAGAYDALALSMQKYDTSWGLQMKCITLLHMLAVKEEVIDKKGKAAEEERRKPGVGESWQEPASVVLDALMGSMHKFLAPGIETFRNITRHHKINSEKAERHGALKDWFDPHSEIPPG